MPKQNQTDALLALFKRLDTQAGEAVIVTVPELRDAADLLGIFPEHRFRKAFHEALQALVQSDRLIREGDDLFEGPTVRRPARP